MCRCFDEVISCFADPLCESTLFSDMVYDEESIKVNTDTGETHSVSYSVVYAAVCVDRT